MFHAPTTLFLTAMLILASLVMVWLVLRGQADRAVAMWCLGSLFAGIGVVLFGLRPYLPVVLTFHGANVLLMWSFVCWTQSLRMTLQQPWHWRVWWTLLALIAVYYSVLFEWSSQSGRAVGVRVVLGLLAIYAALWTLRLARRSGGSNAAIIGVVYMVFGLVMIVWSRNADHSPHPASSTWDAGLVAAVELVSAMVAHFCYVGMMLDLAARERLQALQAQREAQLTQHLDTQLRRMDRRHRMVIVSGSLAHEINQPLTAAMVNAQMAERQWGVAPSATPVLLSLLDHIESNIERASRILQRIRSDKDAPGASHRPLDLQQLTDQVLAFLAADLQRYAVTLTQTRCARPLNCMGDEVALSQVLVNLLRNAAQAMAGCAVRTLSVECAVHQGQAQVVVCDTGPGLSEALSRRWGEPFLSTSQDGLGMGLAISRDIVLEHRGELSLNNRPQGGLMAVVSIPLIEEGAP